MKKLCFTALAVAALFCSGVMGADERGKTNGGKTFTVSGKTIQRAVAPKMPTLNDAYNKRLLDKPDLAGTVTVMFAIDIDGKVLSAEVRESTMNDKEFENIVVNIVQTWVFTKQDGLSGLSEIFYTFSFLSRPER